MMSSHAKLLSKSEVGKRRNSSRHESDQSDDCYCGAYVLIKFANIIRVPPNP